MRKPWMCSLASVILLVGCATAARGPAGGGMDMTMGMGMHAPLPIDQEQAVIRQCAVASSERISPAQQDVIDAHFATPDHRIAHALWHAVRSGFDPADKAKVLSAYGSGWDPGPARHLCPPPQNNSDASDYNPIGEDFMYMHHQMVLELSQGLLSAKAQCIAPWTSIPIDSKAQWPVPGVKKGVKTKAAYNLLVEWDSFLQNPDNLRAISLSQLGWALEFTIHNSLHMRYADDRPPLQFQANPKDPNQDGAPVPPDGNFPDPWPYNAKAYNWLADPYSAAVNPVFWKIHGYVDHALTLWLQANSKTYTASSCPIDQKGKPDPACYEWKGRWIGAPVQVKVGDAPIAKGFPGQSLPAPPPPMDSFNQNRLRQQGLGAINDSDIHPPAGKGFGATSPSNAIDLIEVARQRLCP